MNESLSKVALSKAQKAVGLIPTDLATRVTALEMSDQAIDSRIDVLESALAAGYTGTVTVVLSVDFTAQTTTTKTITITDGIITGVANG